MLEKWRSKRGGRVLYVSLPPDAWQTKEFGSLEVNFLHLASKETKEGRQELQPVPSRTVS